MSMEERVLDRLLATERARARLERKLGKRAWLANQWRERYKRKVEECEKFYTRCEDLKRHGELLQQQVDSHDAARRSHVDTLTEIGALLDEIGVQSSDGRVVGRVKALIALNGAQSHSEGSHAFDMSDAELADTAASAGHYDDKPQTDMLGAPVPSGPGPVRYVVRRVPLEGNAFEGYETWDSVDEVVMNQWLLSRPDGALDPERAHFYATSYAKRLNAQDEP